ncbi:hypothetical protein CF150_22068, partial [Pseudomonas sp. CF150]
MLARPAAKLCAAVGWSWGVGAAFCGAWLLAETDVTALLHRQAHGRHRIQRVGLGVEGRLLGLLGHSNERLGLVIFGSNGRRLYGHR